MILPLEERFWARVDKSGRCWIWVGTKANGYGELRVHGVDQRAHRVSWEMHFGPIPDGLFVCHRCDNPPCVNPSHLFLGTQKDNMADCRSKGRTETGSTVHPELLPRGESHWHAKFSEADVVAIRTQYAEGGISLRSIARQYGVSYSAIHLIVLRRSWRHVAA